MSNSVQHRLVRVRPPRVKITYDVESGDAIELKELPLVVGLLADLSGDRDPEAPLPYLKERGARVVGMAETGRVVCREATLPARFVEPRRLCQKSESRRDQLLELCRVST